jgi:hypothetical protein
LGAALVLSATALGLAGCPGTIPGEGPGQVTDEGPEPNGSFELAKTVSYDDEDAVRLTGSVTQLSDLDVFELGPLQRGDRVVADAATPGSSLDVSMAVFDAQGRLTYENDDFGSGANFLDSYLDFIVRHDGSPYYLVVTHSAFAGAQTYLGSYRVDVQITPGLQAPSPRSQVLFLDFDGASVNSPVLGQFQLEPFDAADIDDEYAGDTELIKQQIRATFVQNFERFNVIIVTSDEPAPADPFSIVFFGGFNRQAFGLSENVDLYNIDLCDDSIIYTETFGAGAFAQLPTAQGMGIAIGNVGTHEAGHLLGLNHTDDDDDLMDDRSSATAFLDDQEFKEAPLSSDIMPIGTQDGVLLLAETVGLTEGSSVAEAPRSRSARTPPAPRSSQKSADGETTGVTIVRKTTRGFDKESRHTK